MKFSPHPKKGFKFEKTQAEREIEEELRFHSLDSLIVRREDGSSAKIKVKVTIED